MCLNGLILCKAKTVFRIVNVQTIFVERAVFIKLYYYIAYIQQICSQQFQQDSSRTSLYELTTFIPLKFAPLISAQTRISCPFECCFFTNIIPASSFNSCEVRNCASLLSLIFVNSRSNADAKIKTF